MKAFLKGKFIVVIAYITKTEQVQINNLIMQEQPKSKVSTRKGDNKGSVEISEMEIISKSKKRFFQRINEMHESSANLTTRWKERMQINAIRNEKIKAQQTPPKFRRLLGTTTQNCLQ